MFAANDHPAVAVLAGIACTLLVTPARADVVTDWNARANAIIAEARLGTPPAVRIMAIVQTAVHDAVAAAGAAAAATEPATRSDGRSPRIEAAVAAANRAVLEKLLPAQQPSVHAAYRAGLAAIADPAARDAGIAIGERAAAAVLAARADDMPTAPDAYRPHTTAGAYVPTVAPAASQWPQRKPWLMSSPAQFRPAPPPVLGSAAWARDFDEVKALGMRASGRRDAAQTEVARFWDYSMPAIYHGLLQSVATGAGRDALRNARLFAFVSQAMDDALIAVFDAKYHYGFWRPVTAIRNGDIDGNDATVRDPAWTPLIDTPGHPEYPCAHCILAAVVATLIEADAGTAGFPVIATRSPTAGGAIRQWSSPDALMREVADARISGGLHYRTSTEVGLAMGRRIGELAAGLLPEGAH